MTDSGDGGEGGGDELPCATEGEGHIQSHRCHVQWTYVSKL